MWPFQSLGRKGMDKHLVLISCAELQELALLLVSTVEQSWRSPSVTLLNKIEALAPLAETQLVMPLAKMQTVTSWAGMHMAARLGRCCTVIQIAL